MPLLDHVLFQKDNEENKWDHGAEQREENAGFIFKVE